MVDTTTGYLKCKTYSNDSVSKVVLVKLALYVSVFLFGAVNPLENSSKNTD